MEGTRPRVARRPQASILTRFPRRKAAGTAVAGLALCLQQRPKKNSIETRLEPVDCGPSRGIARLHFKGFLVGAEGSRDVVFQFPDASEVAVRELRVLVAAGARRLCKHGGEPVVTAPFRLVRSAVVLW